MSFLRTLVKLFAGQPYILHMRLAPERVHITVTRGEQKVTHNEIIKHRSLPTALSQFLKTQPDSDGNGYFVTLPTARQLCVALRPHNSEAFQFDTVEIDQLQSVDCPSGFKIHWQFNNSRQTLNRTLVGADGYLGEGWFFRGNQAWQAKGSLTPDMLQWLDQPEIDSRTLHVFVAKSFPQFKPLNYECDLQIESGFQAKLKVIKTLKQNLDVQLVSNMPEIQKHVMPIQGDPLNLISGTKLLSGWFPKLRGRLLKVAKSEQPMRFTGQDLLAFIQDDLAPAAADLDVDLNMLRLAYPIDDAAQIPLKWTIEHEIAQGIGRYLAIPCLQIEAELLPISKITKSVENGTRFLQVGDRWLEFTPRFRERYAEWQQKNIDVIQLAPQEIMGANVERLNKLGVLPPFIEVSKAASERDQARLLIDVMREHGLPVGIYGLQNEIGSVIADACSQLLRQNRRASILWLTPRRKKQEIANILKKAGILFTDQFKRLDGQVLLASPESLASIDQNWTLIIFSDLDVIAASDHQSKALATLRRTWSISTFTRPDWHRDVLRVQRILQALGLTRNELKRFLELCTGVYTKQADNLFSRLTSPFKRIIVNSDTPANESGDVPIPPRRTEWDTRPLGNVDGVYRPVFETVVKASVDTNIGYTPAAEKFVEQARKFVNRVEPPTQAVPFTQYWPTYDVMTSAQQKWYFYWRSQVRAGNYLPADKSYLFVHIYEVLNLIGFDTPQAAFDYLATFWHNYRSLYQLDGYLVNWIADFLAVHKLSKSPLEWYAYVLEQGGYPAEKDIAIEAWFSLGKELKFIPIELLRMLSEYNPIKSKFYEQCNGDGVVDRAFGQALEAIDTYLRQTTQKGFVDKYRPSEKYLMKHWPFASALVVAGRKTEVTIALVPRWSSAIELHSSVTAILKYTENLLRRQRNFKGSLRGIQLPSEWAKVLDAAFPSSASEPKVTKRRSPASTEMEDQASPVAFAPITIDYSRVSALATESDEVRSRLIVDEATEPEFGAKPETASKPSQFPPMQAEATTKLNVERPSDTPAHLLTDLVAVHDVISGDRTALNILNHLKQHDWEAETDTVHAVLEGEFLNVVLDRINERALELLGDQLIFTENDQLVVTEDYRDELAHLLSHPSSQEMEQTGGTPTALYDDLTTEWAEFVSKMQPHHWEALSALLIQEDVVVRLDAIARSVYTTLTLLIDEINDFALECIGDIVIEGGEPPKIEHEDFETIRALRDWALENVIKV